MPISTRRAFLSLRHTVNVANIADTPMSNGFEGSHSLQRFNALGCARGRKIPTISGRNFCCVSPCQLNIGEQGSPAGEVLAWQHGPAQALINMHRNSEVAVPFLVGRARSCVMFRPILSIFLLATHLLAPCVQAMTQEEVVRELIDAPVYSTDGHEVGTVADIELDQDNLFSALLMRTARNLGFGERTVRVPGSAFIALRGSVVLDLPAQSMDVLVEQSLEEAPQ